MVEMGNEESFPRLLHEKIQKDHGIDAPADGNNDPPATARARRFPEEPMPPAEFAEMRCKGAAGGHDGTMDP